MDWYLLGQSKGRFKKNKSEKHHECSGIINLGQNICEFRSYFHMLFQRISVSRKSESSLNSCLMNALQVIKREISSMYLDFAAGPMNELIHKGKFAGRPTWQPKATLRDDEVVDLIDLQKVSQRLADLEMYSTVIMKESTATTHHIGRH